MVNTPTRYVHLRSYRLISWLGTQNPKTKHEADVNKNTRVAMKDTLW